MELRFYFFFSNTKKINRPFSKKIYNLRDEQDSCIYNAIAVSFLEGIVNEDYMKDIKTHNLLGNNLKKRN